MEKNWKHLLEHWASTSARRNGARSPSCQHLLSALKTSLHTIPTHDSSITVALVVHWTNSPKGIFILIRDTQDCVFVPHRIEQNDYTHMDTQ